MENGKKKAVVGNNLTDSNVEIYHRKLKRTHFMKKSFYVVYKFYCYFALFWSRMKGKEKYDIIKYNIKCVDFMINIMCPLGYKLSTIIEYRNLDICINGLKIILPDRLKCDSTVEDIYNMLGRIPKSDALKLLRKISPDLLASERLAYFLFNKDKEHFIETLLSGKYNLQDIKGDCDVYGFEQKRVKILDQMSGKKVDWEIVHLESESIINKFEGNEFYSEYYNLYKQVRKTDIFSEKISKRYLYLVTKNNLFVYFILMEEYTSFERENLDKVIGKIKRDPYYRTVYDKVYSIYIRKDAKKRFNVADASNILEVISNELSEIVADNSSRVNSKGVTKTDSNNNNENFFIGEDYFKQQPDSDKNRYFCKLKKCVSDEGGTKFIEFINWLAKEGYIENTSETKATFAFRLTGICPPKKIVEKVEWKEKATYLFYIIKNFHKKEDSKREKLEKFFSCKDDLFKNVARFSSHAKRGEKTTKDTFLLKIRELYPDIEK